MDSVERRVVFNVNEQRATSNRLLAVVVLSLVAIPARAQNPPAPPKPAAAQPAAQQPASPPPGQPKRALDIRGQAPAPEIVTVRPREVPAFSRSIIGPLYEGLQTPVTSLQLRSVVVFPGPLPVVRAEPPNNPSRPPE